MAERTLGADQVLGDALLNEGAFGVRESLQHIPLRARESALIARRLSPPQSALRLFWSEAGVDGNCRLVIGEEDPVAILLGKVTPGAIDIVSKRDENVSQILPAPGRGPRGDGPFPNAEGIVRDHGAFCHVVDSPQAVTLWASPFWRVGGELLRMKHRLMWRVGSGTRIQHPK